MRFSLLCVLFSFWLALPLVLAANAPGAPVSVAPAEPLVLAPVEEDFTYDDHAQRDPFWPLVTAGGAIVTYDTNFAVTEMVLEGVVTDGDGGIAIINGNVVEQGRQFGMYTVTRIEQDKVTLVKDGQVSELRIKKEE
ncbi:MAG: hypothetical protein HQL20_09280 [Candidatus Omnitrophica bacterium]|nr:hypothetical protein [Candidatus Omnitrophota bacterium]